ncbi:aldo/keto reductase [Halobaculum sp. MBLA0147]|uniref:aldo/keto reductase n=1 Tax=Halobaculum sp. MBLA0147 TaxID=3079934 RepID=UPI0035265FC4
MTQFHRFGLGTYELEGEQCTESVATALDAGYRHVDTAQGYDNEREVAAGIERSSVAREDVFLATKLSTEHLGYEAAVETARASADRLGVDTIDLLYVHWPIDSYDAPETCRALNDLHAEGLIDHVGLSNFRPDQLDTAHAHLDVPIFAHQVECHPLLPQADLREYAREDDHWLVAYSPIARNRVAEVPEIVAVADEHDATPAQVALAWLLSKECVAAIPKATSETHVRENLAATELSLPAETLARVDAIEERERIVDFERAPWNAVADD